MADETKTITVEALQFHTYDGKAYEIGDTYELPEDLVESLATQGKAVRVDRVEHAKAQAEAYAEARRKAADETQ